MNLLNRHDAPCDEIGGQINLEECITKGEEEKLNCTIPDMSTGEVMAPIGKIDNKLCSSGEEFKNYTRISDMNYYTELQLSTDFGCTNSCQDSSNIEMSRAELWLNYKIQNDNNFFI